MPLDWTAIIVAVLATVNATIAAVAAVFAVRAHHRITEVSVEVDGRMTELLEATKKSSHAMGVEDERLREKDSS